MIPTNGSSFGRAGGRLRRYPGGTENASIFATVRGSIPNRRAASRRLSPSTYTARRTCPYSSTPFIPPPSAHLGRRFTAAGLSLRRVLYPAASVMDFLSGALIYTQTNAGVFKTVNIQGTAWDQLIDPVTPDYTQPTSDNFDHFTVKFQKQGAAGFAQLIDSTAPVP